MIYRIVRINLSENDELSTKITYILTVNFHYFFLKLLLQTLLFLNVSYGLAYF